MAQTVDSFIASQREALNTRRTETHARLLSVQAELDDIDRELRALDTYEAARSGQPKRAVSTTKPRDTGKRAVLLKLIKNNPAITRSEIIEKTGVKGDASAEQSISNALSALKTQKKIVQDADGKYAAA